MTPASAGLKDMHFSITGASGATSIRVIGQVRILWAQEISLTPVNRQNNLPRICVRDNHIVNRSLIRNQSHNPRILHQFLGN